MADNSPIEWTDATWNPIRGCTRVSEGCRNCYAETFAARFSGEGQPYEGLARRVGTEARWTGKVIMAPDHILTLPLRWKKPRRIFVNAMSDLFHEALPDRVIDRVFAVMALCPQHTFQILTKRSDRMAEYMNDPATRGRIARQVVDLLIEGLIPKGYLTDANFDDTWPVISIGDPDAPDDIEPRLWPLPNVWLGVSIEDQATADERVPHLLGTPAAIRFVSAEPLLGPIDLTSIKSAFRGAQPDRATVRERMDALRGEDRREHYTLNEKWESGGTWSGNCFPKINCVIVGGESGHKARHLPPAPVRSLRDQCAATGTAFFFKQWGSWAPDEIGPEDPRSINYPPGHIEYRKVGKKTAGRKLDGIEHNGLPGGTP